MDFCEIIFPTTLIPKIPQIYHDSSLSERATLYWTMVATVATPHPCTKKGAPNALCQVRCCRESSWRWYNDVHLTSGLQIYTLAVDRYLVNRYILF